MYKKIGKAALFTDAPYCAAEFHGFSIDFKLKNVEMLRKVLSDKKQIASFPAGTKHFYIAVLFPHVTL